MSPRCVPPRPIAKRKPWFRAPHPQPTAFHRPSEDGRRGPVFVRQIAGHAVSAQPIDQRHRGQSRRAHRYPKRSQQVRIRPERVGTAPVPPLDLRAWRCAKSRESARVRPAPKLRRASRQTAAAENPSMHYLRPICLSHHAGAWLMPSHVAFVQAGKQKLPVSSTCNLKVFASPQICGYKPAAGVAGKGHRFRVGG